MESKFAGDNIDFLKSEEILGKKPSIEKIFSLWKQVMSNTKLEDIAVCDVPFYNEKNQTNGLVHVSNGLMKYHFYLKPNSDNTRFVLRLENWDNNYVSTKK